MRVQFYDRSGYLLTEFSEALEQSSGLKYSSVMPGGMATATLHLPWPRSVKHGKLNGAAMVIRYQGDIVWWGRINEDTTSIQQGDRGINISAAGPWENAAKKPFTQNYPSAINWTATEILGSAIFGNLEDVIISNDNWAVPGIQLSPITWSDANIQTVIGDCLRIGDSTTSPWQFLILPPRFEPQTPTFLYGAKCNNVIPGSLTATSVSGANSTVTLDNNVYQHGGGSFRCSAGASGTAYAYKDVTAAATYHAHGWFMLPSNFPGVAHDLLTFFRADGTPLACFYINSSGNLTLLDRINTVVYDSTGPTAMGLGCWHWISMRCTIGAGTAVISGRLDNVQIVSATSINLGATNVGRVGFGLVRSTANARTLWMSGLVIYTGFKASYDSGLFSETLPEASIIKTDTSDYDFMVSISDIQDSISLTRSTHDTTNILDVTYSGSNISMFPGFGNSAPTIGQMWGSQSISKTSSSTLAGYLQNRVLAQKSDEVASLTSFTLHSPPIAKGGYPLPLPLIRAGMRFCIRELKEELGNMYVGQVEYTSGDSGQEESCSITPFGAPSNISVGMARKLSTQLT